MALIHGRQGYEANDINLLSFTPSRHFLLT